MHLETITANGTTTYTDLRPGGRYALFAVGTFGSGTLSLQWTDGTTGVEFTNGSLTADGAIEVVAPLNTVQFVLTGATTPSIKIGVTPITQRH